MTKIIIERERGFKKLGIFDIWRMDPLERIKMQIELARKMMKQEEKDPDFARAMHEMKPGDQVVVDVGNEEPVDRAKGD